MQFVQLFFWRIGLFSKFNMSTCITFRSKKKPTPVTPQQHQEEPNKEKKKIQQLSIKLKQTSSRIPSQQISRHLVPALFGLFLVLERQLSTWIFLLGNPFVPKVQEQTNIWHPKKRCQKSARPKPSKDSISKHGVF